MQLSLLDDDKSDFRKPYILISLREDVYQKLISGNKKYEYRRIFITEPSNVFIYITGKRQAVCAFAEFGKPIIGTIDDMIRVNKAEPKPNPDGIKKYFENRKNKTCYAIPILRVEIFNEISLKTLRINFGEFYPPQSFIYLSKNKKLLDLLLKQREHI